MLAILDLIFVQKSKDYVLSVSVVFLSPFGLEEVANSSVVFKLKEQSPEVYLQIVQSTAKHICRQQQI